MSNVLTKSISYWVVSKGLPAREATYTCEYVPFQELPRASSIDGALRPDSAAPDDAFKRDVLNDLYRYLVFAHYAVPGGSRKKGEQHLVHAELDARCLYGGTLREGESFESAHHPGGTVRTNASGAVVCLVMAARNTTQVNQVLGGILVSMLGHSVFATAEKGWPQVDVETLRASGLR